MSQFWPETNCPKCRGDGWAHMGICHSEKVKLDNRVMKTPYDGYVVDAEIYSDIFSVICDCNSPAADILRNSEISNTKATLSQKVRDKYPKHEIIVYDSEKEIWRQVMNEKSTLETRKNQSERSQQS